MCQRLLERGESGFWAGFIGPELSCFGCAARNLWVDFKPFLPPAVGFFMMRGVTQHHIVAIAVGNNAQIKSDPRRPEM